MPEEKIVTDLTPEQSAARKQRLADRGIGRTEPLSEEEQARFDEMAQTEAEGSSKEAVGSALESLHTLLNKDGTYTKGIDEFKTQFATEEKQSKLFDLLSKKGTYTKSKEEFINQFFADPVKKKDFSTNSKQKPELRQKNPMYSTESDYKSTSENGVSSSESKSDTKEFDYKSYEALERDIKKLDTYSKEYALSQSKFNAILPPDQPEYETNFVNKRAEFEILKKQKLEYETEKAVSKWDQTDQDMYHALKITAKENEDDEFLGYLDRTLMGASRSIVKGLSVGALTLKPSAAERKEILRESSVKLIDQLSNRVVKKTQKDIQTKFDTLNKQIEQLSIDPDISDEKRNEIYEGLLRYSEELKEQYNDLPNIASSIYSLNHDINFGVVESFVKSTSTMVTNVPRQMASVLKGVSAFGGDRASKYGMDQPEESELAETVYQSLSSISENAAFEVDEDNPMANELGNLLGIMLSNGAFSAIGGTPAGVLYLTGMMHDEFYHDIRTQNEQGDLGLTDKQMLGWSNVAAVINTGIFMSTGAGKLIGKKELTKEFTNFIIKNKSALEGTNVSGGFNSVANLFYAYLKKNHKHGLQLSTAMTGTQAVSMGLKTGINYTQDIEKQLKISQDGVVQDLMHTARNGYLIGFALAMIKLPKWDGYDYRAVEAALIDGDYVAKIKETFQSRRKELGEKRFKELNENLNNDVEGIKQVEGLNLPADTRLAIAQLYSARAGIVTEMKAKNAEKSPYYKDALNKIDVQIESLFGFEKEGEKPKTEKKAESKKESEAKPKEPEQKQKDDDSPKKEKSMMLKPVEVLRAELAEMKKRKKDGSKDPGLDRQIEEWSKAIISKNEKKIKEIEQEIGIDKNKQIFEDVEINNFLEKIEGGFLNKKERIELEKEIESNYGKPNEVVKFGPDNKDIRTKLFNYDNPISEKTINGVNIRIAEGLTRNKRKTYLLYSNGKIVGEFYSVKNAEHIVNLIEKRLISGEKTEIYTEKDVKETQDKVETISIDELSTDPKRFQYKADVNEKGVSDKLKGRKYNPDLAGVVSVWIDPKNGKKYVINGHHRYELALENKVKNIDIRYIEAKTASEARQVGAMQNIAEGQGTVIDAAKIFREEGSNVDALKEYGLGLSDTKTGNGLSLANLSDPLFDLVVNGKLPENVGVIIGRNINKPEIQEQFYNKIKGKNFSQKTIEIMAQDINAAPVTKEVVTDLFGTTEKEMAQYEDRAKLISSIRDVLNRTKNILGKTAKNKSFLEKYGNEIDAEKSKGAGEDAAVGLAVFDKLRNSSKEIKDIIDRAVEEAKDSKDKTKIYEKATGEIIKKIPKILEAKSSKDVGTSPRIEKDKPKSDKVEEDAGLKHKTPDKILDFLDKAIDATDTQGRLFDATIAIPLSIANQSLKIVRATYLASKQTVKDFSDAVDKGLKYLKEKGFIIERDKFEQYLQDPDNIKLSGQVDRELVDKQIESRKKNIDNNLAEPKLSGARPQRFGGQIFYVLREKFTAAARFDKATINYNNVRQMLEMDYSKLSDKEALVYNNLLEIYQRSGYLPKFLDFKKVIGNNNIESFIETQNPSTPKSIGSYKKIMVFNLGNIDQMLANTFRGWDTKLLNKFKATSGFTEMNSRLSLHKINKERTVAKRQNIMKLANNRLKKMSGNKKDNSAKLSTTTDLIGRVLSPPPDVKTMSDWFSMMKHNIYRSMKEHIEMTSLEGAVKEVSARHKTIAETTSDFMEFYSDFMSKYEVKDKKGKIELTDEGKEILNQPLDVNHPFIEALRQKYPSEYAIHNEMVSLFKTNKDLVENYMIMRGDYTKYNDQYTSTSIRKIKSNRSETESMTEVDDMVKNILQDFGFEKRTAEQLEHHAASLKLRNLGALGKDMYYDSGNYFRNQFNAFDSASKEALVTPTLLQFETTLRNRKFGHLVGSTEKINLLRAEMVKAINYNSRRDEISLNFNTETTAGRRAESISMGALNQMYRVLWGASQPFKQSMQGLYPLVTTWDTNSFAHVTKTMIQGGPEARAMMDLIVNNSPTGSRNALTLMDTGIGRSKMPLKGISDFAGKITIADADFRVATVAWFSAYRQWRVKEHNIKNFNWEKEAKHPNQEALSHANTETALSQGASIRELQADFIKSPHWYMQVSRAVLMPYATFLTQMKMSTWTDASQLRTDPYAARRILGYGAVSAGYHSMGTAFKFSLGTVWNRGITHFVKDEDTKKLLRGLRDQNSMKLSERLYSGMVKDIGLFMIPAAPLLENIALEAINKTLYMLDNYMFKGKVFNKDFKMSDPFRGYEEYVATGAPFLHIPVFKESYDYLLPEYAYIQNAVEYISILDDGKYDYVNHKGVRTTKRITPEERQAIEVLTAASVLGVFLVDQNYRGEVNAVASQFRKLRRPGYLKNQLVKGEFSPLDAEVSQNMLRNNLQSLDISTVNLAVKLLTDDAMFRDKSNHVDRLRVKLTIEFLQLAESANYDINDMDKLQRLIQRIFSVDTQLKKDGLDNKSWEKKMDKDQLEGIKLDQSK